MNLIIYIIQQMILLKFNYGNNILIPILNLDLILRRIL